jgi:HTH-type transcriptional regulator/antitoxin HigA
MNLELVKEVLPKNISKDVKESSSVQEEALKTLMFHSPLLIETKADNKKALEIIKFLINFSKDVDSMKLREKAVSFMKDLSIKVAEFEKKNRTIEKADPAALLKSFMNDFNLTPKDFEKELGSADLVRKIIAGKRDISKQGAIKLAKRFSVSPTLFLDLE